MTRDALIEALAEVMFYGGLAPEEFEAEWGTMSRSTKALYRDAALVVLPAIVAFVADFITTECSKDVDAATCAERWREEMQS